MDYSEISALIFGSYLNASQGVGEAPYEELELERSQV